MVRRGVLSILFILLCFALPAQTNRQYESGYNKADSIAAHYHGFSLDNLPLLAQKLTQNLSGDEQKFRVIYRWICENIAYDHKMFVANKRKRASLRSAADLKTWNDEFSKSVLKILRTRKRTVCTGYAYLLSELAMLTGIKCVVVHGYGRNTGSNVGGTGVPNHSWNAVKLNDQWLLCDPTWSAGYYDADQSQFVNKFNPVYFLSDPSSFVQNHFPLDTTWILLKEKPTLSQFLNAPVFYAAAYPFDLKSVNPETFDLTATRDEKFVIGFSGNAGQPIANAEILGTRADSPTQHYANLAADDNGQYKMECRVKTKGVHVLHVLLENRCVFTYRLTVR